MVIVSGVSVVNLDSLIALLPDGFGPTLGPSRSSVASRRQSSRRTEPPLTFCGHRRVDRGPDHRDAPRRQRHVSVDARTRSGRACRWSGTARWRGGSAGKDKEGVTVDASDRELQQYLFDLHGYLVLHNVLEATEVAELNRLIDAQRLPSPRESIRFGSAAGKHGPDHGFLNWGEPFCRLLDHEAIMPILRLRLGDWFRLDRLYGIRMLKGQTMGSMHADYGASALNSFTRPGERFHFAPNGIYEGFTVAAWNLADAGSNCGGFWCIPGSHKSNFKVQRQIHEAPEKASCVIIPEIPAGSVVLFSEAMMHGTALWKADHERRTLLFKYCVSQMAWSRARVLPPPDVPLTPRQQALLTEPADPHTFVPSLFSDGPGVAR